MDSLNNSTYIFLPFSYNDNRKYKAIVDACDKSDLWTLCDDKVKYLLKFVSDKIDNKNRDKCQCFHYILNDSVREKFGLGTDIEWFSTCEHSLKGETVNFKFRILNVQLFVFSTGVGIISFNIEFENSDTFWISNALYYIKKVSREKIFNENKESFSTMLDLSVNITKELDDISKVDFFYYANPTTERANVLSYIEVDSLDNYKTDLFFLRRCYSDGYFYTENLEAESKEIIKASKDIFWGVSSETAVCLACPSLGKEDFIKNTFFNNFNAQYLFMYVFLLHQKYVLYMFMTNIGIGTYDNLEPLEEYRNQLYEFENDFVFSMVTEVPQYQNLYDRITEAFSLKQIFEDVHEPLISLEEVRREKDDKESKIREDRVNNALWFLTILSVFSALVDSFDFTSEFGEWFLNENGIKIVQVICIVLIIVCLIYNLGSRFVQKIRNNKLKNKSGKNN